MFRILLLTVLVLSLSVGFSFAESLEVQQVKNTIKQLEDAGIAVPPSMYDALKTLQKKDRGPASNSANAYGKSLSQMSCSDDISGPWKTNSGLTKLNLGSNGVAKLWTDDSTGQYYTRASFRWDATATTFSADYDYVKTYNTKTKALERERKPKSDTVKCQFMGNMLDIGGVIYSR